MEGTNINPFWSAHPCSSENYEQDVQDILLRTARKNDAGDSDWTLNGAGLHVNHKVMRHELNRVCHILSHPSHS